MKDFFTGYPTHISYDEYIDSQSNVRAQVKGLVDRIHQLGLDELLRRQAAAESLLLTLGVTFNVHGGEKGKERIFPMDILPRVLPFKEWEHIERGLKQRTFALNAFIQDIYNRQLILKNRVIPQDVVFTSPGYKNQCRGMTPPKGVWIHIGGMDMVRDHTGTFYVLEDNLRCPSGVSYVLENRQVMKRTFPQVFESLKPVQVEDYPLRLKQMLQATAPEAAREPVIAVLTPGIFNSAYFEHSFLAQQMGVELVTGSDLYVEKKCLYMRTTRGKSRVDVLYRRIDDDFIDPRVFRPDSLLGVSGLMDCYREGNLTLANAPGTGIADDKVIYAYVPEIIKFYLGEEPILPNVPTYLCHKEKDLSYVLDNMEKLVIKSAHESGGYGVLIGPHASQEELSNWRKRIHADPRNYLAQLKVDLSVAPVIINGKLEPRHIDLRPFILYGRDVHILPGGLSRVALKKGSLVVNSSQGGGSKDTWVVHEKEYRELANQTETENGENRGNHA